MSKAERKLENEHVRVKVPKSTRAALKALGELFSSPKRWTKGAFARKSPTRRGADVYELSKAAKCFCLSGGITRVCGDGGDDYTVRLKARVRMLLQKAIVEYTGPDSDTIGIINFNDDGATTFEDVQQVIRRARKLAA